MLSLPPEGELENICPRASPTARIGEVRLPVQHVTRRLQPVVVEDGLHLCDDRAFRLEVGVAPMIGILGVARPFVADAHAAGEADGPVDHQQLAMRAIVQLVERIPARRVKLPHFDAGVAHPAQQPLVHPRAADPVEQHMHFHAGPRPFGQRTGEGVADPARPVDVRLERDRPLRAMNGVQHGGKDLVAIQKHLEAVAGKDDRTEQDAERALELRIGNRVKVLDMPFDRLLPGHGVEDGEDDDEGDGDGGDDRDRLCARRGVLPV